METILRANIGTGFRSPNFVDLFYPGYNNPNLQPEHSIGWDAGFEQPLLENKLRVGANYFQNEFDNLISYNPAISAPDNVQKAKTIGIETFGVFKPVADLTLRASYTYLAVAEDRVTDRRLLRRPRHTGEISANYHFLKRLDAGARLLLVGDRHDFDPATDATVKGGSYVKLDLSLACEICPHFSVFGRIENVADQRYAEVLGYPALGRAFWGGGTVKF
jgi:vitamin B12 transporter